MSRPSQNIDKKLIKAGKELIKTKGVSNLTVRQVSRDAGVNLGMFNYYFGTKQVFIEKILEHIYEEFFSRFKIELEREDNCFEQLKKAILNIGLFTRENRQLIESFMEDVILGNKEIVEFVKKNMTRHITIIIKLIKQCQKEEYIIKAPLYNVVPVILASIVGPNIILRVAEKHIFNSKALKLLYKSVSIQIMSDKAIRQRMNIVFKGLTP
ncbi:MAG: TetR/AcrR family transcriptional regulator [Elusimicrobiota bacterium]